MSEKTVRESRHFLCSKKVRKKGEAKEEEKKWGGGGGRLSGTVGTGQPLIGFV